jgi:Mor family transcriptional regulator
MGKVPKEEKTRNAALVKDYQSRKFTMVQLISKYQITSTRIYEIVKKYKAKMGQ